MGRAIAVRRAAPERIGNLTWPVTPDKHGERESFQTRSRLPSEPTPKCQSFPGGFFWRFFCGTRLRHFMRRRSLAAAARIVETCGVHRRTLRHCCGNGSLAHRWENRWTLRRSLRQPSLELCDNGRWRVVGQPLTLVRGQASPLFSLCPTRVQSAAALWPGCVQIRSEGKRLSLGGAGWSYGWKMSRKLVSELLWIIDLLYVQLPYQDRQGPAVLI